MKTVAQSLGVMNLLNPTSLKNRTKNIVQTKEARLAPVKLSYLKFFVFALFFYFPYIYLEIKFYTFSLTIEFLSMYIFSGMLNLFSLLFACLALYYKERWCIYISLILLCLTIFVSYLYFAILCISGVKSIFEIQDYINKKV